MKNPKIYLFLLVIWMMLAILTFVFHVSNFAVQGICCLALSAQSLLIYKLLNNSNHIWNDLPQGPEHARVSCKKCVRKGER